MSHLLIIFFTLIIYFKNFMRSLNLLRDTCKTKNSATLINKVFHSYHLFLKKKTLQM
jgi:hypothetical protein